MAFENDVKGDVLADDDTVLIDATTKAAVLAGGVTADLTGDVSGNADKAKNATPVNAVAAHQVLTQAGVAVDGETVTIGAEVYEVDTDGNVVGGNIQVDVSAHAVASQGTLTIGGVVLDTETVTIGATDVYEFDAEDTPNITGGNIRVDISESAGFSTRSQATVTFVNGDIHNDTVVIQGNTHTLKSDGTADSAAVCDISGAASIVRATGTYGLGGVVADGETVTIGADVYEFDDGGGVVGANIAVDVTGGLDKGHAIQQLYDTIVASGTEPVTPTLNLAGFEIAIEYDPGGAAGNAIASTETTPNGGWTQGATLTGGANATALELGPIFLAHLNALGAEANIEQAAGGTDDLVVLTWLIGGVAGNAVTLTETLTAGNCDGAGTFGGTTAGVDCIAADAVTALVTAVTAGDTVGVGAVDGVGDTVVFTADIPGALGDTIGTTELMATGAFGQATLGDTQAGVDCPAANFVTVFVAAVVAASALAHALDGPGDTVHVQADVKGVAGDLIATTSVSANSTWGDVTMGGGVDGTVGVQWEMRSDGVYLYICKATNTIADANWYMVPLTIGAPKRRVVEAAVHYCMKPTDDFIECTAGNITIVLPDGSLEEDEVKSISDRDGNATAGPITIAPESGTIDGAASIQIAADYGVAHIKFDGTNYQTV